MRRKGNAMSQTTTITATRGTAMNRIVSGTIAGAVGIVLLLGGAGTFALWNSSTGAKAGTISSGTLALAPIAGSAGTWTDTTYGRNTGTTAANIVMVPGNSYSYTRQFSVKATGTDLKAVLTYDEASIKGTSELIQATTRSLDVSSSSANVSRVGSSNTFTVTPAAGTSTVSVVFSIALPQTAETGQNGTVDLTGLKFTLTQTAIGS
ncbi:alternate signal-mediated exported protein [Frondihabitans sp. PhB161]|nr:alternate signal-mediated exported protein [Frondihabitans sp. PhB153]RPF05497.1 alternate signal-mediated exported protein [Frondihabitans sp. PhB161]